MKITHYIYNTFLIEISNKKIAIDPGALYMYWFRFTTVIPKNEWKGITHIFVTHGDPDHYWHADRVAKVSGAPLICNKTMVKSVNGEDLFLGPRSKGLRFPAKFEKYHTLSVDETIEVDGMSITGIKATHGTLTVKVLGPIKMTVTPGPNERIGWGSMGFEIVTDGKKIVNLGDTMLHEKEWQSIKNPDVLMIPIGGRVARNTMGEDEALQAVKIMQPKLVIPCHYNSPGLFSSSLNPADDQYFKRGVEEMGMRCEILKKGESVEI
ncbi:MAG: MBL fold metallo-hydrolase [Spirochaetia bacterium]|nr:MBL fold metallo-hydrolase [Spirochaetia bacterium]